LEKGIPARLTLREGRKFGLSIGGAFLTLGTLIWWRGHPTAASALGVMGGVLVLAGSVLPGKLGPVHRAWMGFALFLSKVTTPIFLAITFFLVIGPVAVIMRLSGWNAMVREENDGSYWVRRPAGPRRRSDLTRQF
jgi:hypothetical protein